MTEAIEAEADPSVNPEVDPPYVPTPIVADNQAEDDGDGPEREPNPESDSQEKGNVDRPITHSDHYEGWDSESEVSDWDPREPNDPPGPSPRYYVTIYVALRKSEKRTTTEDFTEPMIITKTTMEVNGEDDLKLPIVHEKMLCRADYKLRGHFLVKKLLNSTHPVEFVGRLVWGLHGNKECTTAKTRFLCRLPPVNPPPPRWNRGWEYRYVVSYHMNVMTPLVHTELPFEIQSKIALADELSDILQTKDPLVTTAALALMIHRANNCEDFGDEAIVTTNKALDKVDNVVSNASLLRMILAARRYGTDNTYICGKPNKVMPTHTPVLPPLLTSDLRKRRQQKQAENPPKPERSAKFVEPVTPLTPATPASQNPESKKPRRQKSRKGKQSQQQQQNINSDRQLADKKKNDDDPWEIDTKPKKPETVKTESNWKPLTPATGKPQQSNKAKRKPKKAKQPHPYAGNQVDLRSNGGYQPIRFRNDHLIPRIDPPIGREPSPEYYVPLSDTLEYTDPRRLPHVLGASTDTYVSSQPAYYTNIHRRLGRVSPLQGYEPHVQRFFSK